MAKQSIRLLMRDALKDGALTTEQLSTLEAALRENQDRAGSQALRSLLLFIIVAAAWILIRSANIENISLLGAELRNIEIALLLLPLIGAFAFYQYQCSVVLTDLISDVLREIYSVSMPSMTRQGLDEFLTYPIFILIENAFANLEEKDSLLWKTSDTWVVILGLLFMFGPAAALLWSAYFIIQNPIVGPLWSYTVAAIVVVLVFRSLLIFLQWMRWVG